MTRERKELTPDPRELADVFGRGIDLVEDCEPKAKPPICEVASVDVAFDVETNQFVTRVVLKFNCYATPGDFQISTNPGQVTP